MSGLSNYPPGVSGREPQIAGYPEAELDVKCENTIPANRVKFYVIDSTGKPTQATNLGYPVHRLLSETTTDEIDCPFKGRLLMELDGDTATAECPVCGGWIQRIVKDY